MAASPDVESDKDPARELAQLQEGEAVLLARYARDRSPALREELVRRFMPLARSLAMRYRRQTESLDDLVQVAGLGLVKAVDGFDPERGRPFAAYAVPTILGELRRHFRDHVWNVRLPRALQERTMKLDAATAALTDELGRFPTPSELAERLDLSVEDVLEGLEADHARRTLSLDAPRRADEEESTPGVETLESVEHGYDRVEAQMAAQSADLDPREREILRMRFVDNLTQREIAAEFGVSQMQISRISRRALWKLLTAVNGDGKVEPVPRSDQRAQDG
jgi:RNA polymerase sigma-B factor